MIPLLCRALAPLVWLTSLSKHPSNNLQAQPHQQQILGVPGQMLQTLCQWRRLFPGTSTSFLHVSSREGLHSGCFPRESSLSPNSQECQFTLMSDEPGLALLLSGELCSVAGLEQQEAARQCQGERLCLFRQTTVPGCPF